MTQRDLCSSRAHWMCPRLVRGVEVTRGVGLFLSPRVSSRCVGVRRPPAGSVRRLFLSLSLSFAYPQAASGLHAPGPPLTHNPVSELTNIMVLGGLVLSAPQLSTCSGCKGWYYISLWEVPRGRAVHARRWHRGGHLPCSHWTGIRPNRLSRVAVELQSWPNRERRLPLAGIWRKATRVVEP